MQTGADIVLQAAAAVGVSVCFANPGTTEMHFVQALDRPNSKIRPVLCLHETVATGAADGYARIARLPAMTLLHLGPGLANGPYVPLCRLQPFSQRGCHGSSRLLQHAGLANLHNARRAGSPVVNVVGSMSTWHESADALLAMDVEALAATVSCCVHTASMASDLRGDMASACRAATARRAAGLSRVATLMVPHDLSWSVVSGPYTTAATAPPPPVNAFDEAEQKAAMHQFIAACAAAISGEPRGRVALYLGGEALLRAGETGHLMLDIPFVCLLRRRKVCRSAAGDALLNAGRICTKTGASLLCENAFARVDRGEGLPCPNRLPYFPDAAAAELAKYSMIVFVDARRPVATFGYRWTHQVWNKCIMVLRVEHSLQCL